MPDHNILFALDSRGDGLQLLGVLTFQSGKQKRVFDGNRCVKVEVQLVAHDVKLSAKFQLNRSFLAVYLVRRSAHLLVVIRLGNGAAPVNNERRAVFVRNACRTNVHIARRTSRSHLERDLGKVRLPQENFDSTEFLDSEIVVLVVRINNAVERLNGRKGLDGFVRAAKVWTDFFTHLTKVSSCIFLRGVERCVQILTNLNKFLIYVREVLLLLLVDWIHDAPR